MDSTTRLRSQTSKSRISKLKASGMDASCPGHMAGGDGVSVPKMRWIWMTCLGLLGYQEKLLDALWVLLTPEKWTQVARGKLEFQPFLFWKFNRFVRGYLKYYFLFFCEGFNNLPSGGMTLFSFHFCTFCLVVLFERQSCGVVWWL